VGLMVAALHAKVRRMEGVVAVMGGVEPRRNIVGRAGDVRISSELATFERHDGSKEEV
jgi:hypothetical protein